MTIRQDETDAMVAPGDVLDQELEARGITPRAAARQLGVKLSYLTGVLMGEKPITADLALAIEREFGISATFWMNLDSTYQLALARRKLAQSA